MNILQNLQGMLTKGMDTINQAAGGQAGQSGSAGGGLGNLGNLGGLLGPAVLGGLAGALFTSKAARGIAGGALLAGGGALLWNKYKDRLGQIYQADPDPALGGPPSSPEERAKRLVRALVFAAKSDGHIDDKERQAIQTNLGSLNIGADAEALVQQALDEPLDPKLIAEGVRNEEEALEVYTLSCAVIDVDHFMERSYLDALAAALKIPADVQKDLEAKIAAPA